MLVSELVLVVQVGLLICHHMMWARRFNGWINSKTNSIAGEKIHPGCVHQVPWPLEKPRISGELQGGLEDAIAQVSSHRQPEVGAPAVLCAP